MNRDWKDADECHYFYTVHDGKIIGQTHKIAHTKIWVAKVIIDFNVEKYLGHYISLDFAKNSVESYWDIQDRTMIEAL